MIHTEGEQQGERAYSNMAKQKLLSLVLKITETNGIRLFFHTSHETKNDNLHIFKHWLYLCNNQTKFSNFIIDNSSLLDSACTSRRHNGTKVGTSPVFSVCFDAMVGP